LLSLFDTRYKKVRGLWGGVGATISVDRLGERLNMNPESCPKKGTCDKIKRARLNRVCLCCTGIEPVESICARCEGKEKAGEGKPVLVTDQLLTFGAGIL
jgi:hypothetical protein